MIGRLFFKPKFDLNFINLRLFLSQLRRTIKKSARLVDVQTSQLVRKNDDMSSLSHINKKGKASMVDVGQKPIQQRTAEAKGQITLQAATITLIKKNELKKGDVLSIAQFAGIQAAKQTSSLIPLCHPLLLTDIQVSCTLQKSGVEVVARVSCQGQTGVEMEALTAVSVALLTIYDMCKAVDKSMVLGNVRLTEKIKK